MIKKLVICFAIFTTIQATQAQLAKTDNYGGLNLSSDAGSYDRALAALKERNSQECYKLFKRDFIDFDLESIPAGTSSMDNIYAKRLKMMATEIQLPYNDIVKRYIDIYTRPNALMNRVLGLGQYYFPIIESALHKYGLPMELKMLPVIESALVAKATSSARAVGLWQFMLPTGKYYGLEINSFIDERQDPVKSSDAACRFLSDMYKIYKDWTLVIAAYNCGPGNVNKAIRRVPNAQTYWDIWEFLPRETRGYVPAFIAASYAYTFHKAHGLSPVQPSIPLAVDTVQITTMMHFDQISSTLGVPSEVIRELNPQYLRDVIPAASSSYSLILPQAAASEFPRLRSEIIAKDTLYLGKYLESDNLKAGTTSVNVSPKSSSSASSRKTPRTTYKVKSGDTLGHIATRHKVSVKELQKWNSLRGTNLSIGQKLLIY